MKALDSATTKIMLTSRTNLIHIINNGSGDIEVQSSILLLKGGRDNKGRILVDHTPIFSSQKQTDCVLLFHCLWEEEVSCISLFSLMMMS